MKTDLERAQTLLRPVTEAVEVAVVDLRHIVDKNQNPTPDKIMVHQLLAV